MIGNNIWHMESLSNIENYDKAVASGDVDKQDLIDWNKGLKLKSDKCADESLNNTNTHKRG